MNLFHRHQAKPAHAVRTTTPRWSRASRRLLKILTVIAIVLLAARLALPYAIKRYVNQKLNEIPDYRGHVQDVVVSLWRGAYQLKEPYLAKMNGQVPMPLFTAPTVDLSVQWRELFHGAVVGEIVLDRPEINFVVGSTDAASQTSIDSSFVDRVKELFPFDINRLEVRDGSIHYRDLHSSPKVDIHLDEINGAAHHLTNRPKNADELFARVEATGRPLGHGLFRLRAKLNPLKVPAPFELAAELQSLELASINDFLKAYGDFNVKSGTFSAFTEIKSADGKFEGYVKPLFKDIKVQREPSSGLVHKVWETLVATAAKLLENRKTEHVATVVPISGRLDNPHTDIWATIGGLLRNAFIRAIVPGLEGQIASGIATSDKKKDDKK